MLWIAGRHTFWSNSDLVLHKCTKATFEVAGLRLEREVVIDDKCDGSSDCILPLDLGQEEEVMAFMRAVKHGEVNVLTRSQANTEAKLDKVEDDIVLTGMSSVGSGGVGGGDNEWPFLIPHLPSLSLLPPFVSPLLPLPNPP